MPRVKTTRTVRFALWALRIYLLILLSLIALKFARVFSKAGQPDAGAPVTAAGAGTATLTNGAGAQSRQ
jgi:hypothetical protein